MSSWTEPNPSYFPPLKKDTPLAATFLDEHSNLSALIRDYLLESVRNPPTEGFGKNTAWRSDRIQIDGPEYGVDGARPNLRAIWCLACADQQPIDDNSNGWHACNNYTRNVEAEPIRHDFEPPERNNQKQYEFEIPARPGLDINATTTGAVCAIGIPNSNPYNISLAFAGFSSRRSSLRYFSIGSPEGGRYNDPYSVERARRSDTGLSTGVIVGMVVGILIALGMVFWLVRKTIKNRRRSHGQPKVVEGNAGLPVYTRRPLPLQTLSPFAVQPSFRAEPGQSDPPRRTETLPPAYERAMDASSREGGERQDQGPNLSNTT